MSPNVRILSSVWCVLVLLGLIITTTCEKKYDEPNEVHVTRRTQRMLTQSEAD